MSDQSKDKRGISLSSQILIGLTLGLIVGLFLGEKASPLAIVGRAYIGLIQMSILPYMVVALMLGIGSLSYGKARNLAITGGIVLVASWFLAFTIVFLLPLAFPSIEAGSFYSPSLVEVAEVDFIDLYIPVNPFSSLARTVVPAAAVFSIAFGVALLGIFLVLRIQTGLSAIAAIIMLAIPLSVIGIMPGFWLLNHIGERVVEGFPNPILFTATAMIGMIALAGIVVRNSLILVEFIHMALRQGKGLHEALLRAGAVRMRPIFLTAGTTLLGNMVITLDPIFNGLAWAIIFGIAASTLFTLFVIPVLYSLVYAHQAGHGLPARRDNET